MTTPTEVEILGTAFKAKETSSEYKCKECAARTSEDLCIALPPCNPLQRSDLLNIIWIKS